MSALALLMSLIGLGGLAAELTDAHLAASPEHWSNVRIAIAWFFFWIMVAFVAAMDQDSQEITPPKTEQGYSIERICDGYPMIVGSDAYDRALYTNEYRLLGMIDRRVSLGQQYIDERLNAEVSDVR